MRDEIVSALRPERLAISDASFIKILSSAVESCSSHLISSSMDASISANTVISWSMGEDLPPNGQRAHYIRRVARVLTNLDKIKPLDT